MSFNDQGAGYPPLREQSESQYPLPPGEEDERSRPFHNREASNGSISTLPSITPYEHSFSSQTQGYVQDQRVYPSESYRPPPTPGYPQDYNRGVPQQMAFSQSAPRQRTAIACRYCRRRKIRCSGFDQNPEGRCANCQRFQQECIFTPVSSQAQAFVPAHAVYPGMRNMGIGPDGRPRPMYPQGAPLFGAHGQPLPAPQTQSTATYEYPAPSPTGSYSSYCGDDRNSQPPDPSRKRVQPEPHPSILPPPIPGQVSYQRADSAAAPRRGPLDEDLRLPPVTPTGAPITANYSPGSSNSSHSNLQPPQQSSLPFLSRTPPPRASPIEGRVDPMSIGNIMERRPESEIDRSMLGRLDRKA
ncbi:BgTH12-07334 [Blumeria graminis f. sp. triticale]|uniref:BgTH12-07334 n=1 Tax=Blumeria graminis f. sp. triticale TaxID=1689686 RepID=A0A9W4GJ01_BLUGR|nr:hypothetical protein BGT96224_4635 [Blumeria graminis f. sp. tritici 96224]CAD6506408.1 BgTH12-07334 [Blumeria graminis f. sp. triticale]